MLKNILSLVTCFLFIATLLYPTSCKKTEDPVVIKPTPVDNSIGTVSLPTNTKLKADDMVIYHGGGQSTVKDGKFQIENFDSGYYKVQLAQFPNTGFVMYGVSFQGETTIEISAASTALALLMISPITSTLSEEQKKKVASLYKKHTLFTRLVTEIETYAQQGKSFLDSSNSVFDLVNTIQGSRLGGKAAVLTGVTEVYETIKPPTFEGKTMKLQNLSSYAPYYAGIYDESGKEVAIFSLGASRVENTGPDAFIMDGINNLLNAKVCFQNYGIGPQPDCEQEYFKKVAPDVKSYSFKDPGKYTVKVSNAMGNGQSIDKLRTYAAGNTLYLLINEALSNYDKEQTKSLSEDDCYMKVMGEYLLNTLGLGKVGLESKGAYEVLKKFLTDLLDRNLDFVACMKSNMSEAKYTSYIKFLENYKKFLAISKAFQAVGSGTNMLGIAAGLDNFKGYYEYCVEVTASTASLCKESTPTGVVTVDGYCDSYDDFQYNVFKYYYGYEFTVSLKETYNPLIEKYLYVITPDKKAFMPLRISDATGKARLGYTIESTSNPGGGGGSSPTLYAIDDMLNFSKEPKETGFLAAKTGGLYEIMVVTKDYSDPSNVKATKSARVTLTKSINDEFFPCVRKDGKYTQKEPLHFTVPF